jgi:rhodanese-related sulfurtransferase
MGRLLIVDIRSRSAYTRERVPMSMHVPLRRLRRRLAEVDRDRRIALLCRSGHRSAWAARYAATHRQDIATITGGMNAWIATGLPAARCPAPPRHGD